MKRSWNNTGAFHRWVVEHKIGPGMNDNERMLAYMEEEVARPLSKWHTEERKRDQMQILERMKMGLYSGFDGQVGEGWVPILDTLARGLIALGWDRQVSQIKEKFGTLRFYAGRTTEEMDKLIRLAEAETYHTCENCGERGESRHGGWIKTLCDSCAEIEP